MVKNKFCTIVNLTEDTQALRPLTNYRPIGALPFAGRYRIVDFVLSDVAYAGGESVALFIGESGRSIYDHVRSGKPWDLDSQITGGIFTFSQQNWKSRHHLEDPVEDYYYNHRLYMERSDAEYVFVTGSRIIANLDIQSIRRHHIASNKELTVVYKPVLQDSTEIRPADEYKILMHDSNGEQSLVKFENAQTSGLLNVSLNMYFISVEKMMSLIDRALKEEVYLELDKLIDYYSNEIDINSFEYTGYSASIEDIPSYYNANMDMLDRNKFTSLFYSSIPIITKSKNGAPTYFDESSKVTNAIVSSDVTVYGTIDQSVIHRRVEVARDAVVKKSVILQGVQIGQGAKVEYAILDKDTVVEPGVELIGKPDDLLVISKRSVVKS